MGYTQDYVGQLCRTGKIESRQIGRGWYIPKLAVYKDIKKVVEKKKNIAEKEVSKTNSLEDIVIFKKDDDPMGEVSNTSVNKTKVETKFVDVHKESESGTNLKARTEDYYYPSFLSATYSIDDTPLVPTPTRSREPILHHIVSEEDNDTPNHNKVPIRRIPAKNISFKREQQTSRDKFKTVRAAIEDTSSRHHRVEPHEIALKSPMSLMKIASLGVAMVLIASAITFTPNMSIFTADTGILSSISPLKVLQGSTVRAEVISSVPETPLLERFIGYFNSFFKDTIEYKRI